ncbi:MAG: hypothetical protein ACR2F8_05580 [Caulobacteraceae bacterium]
MELGAIAADPFRPGERRALCDLVRVSQNHGTPAVVTSVARGGDLLTVPVTYAVTGVLRGEVRGPWLSIVHRPPVIPAEKAVAFAPVGQDIFPASFAYHYLDQSAPPDIQEQRVELSPPLTLVIQFTGLKGDLADLRVIVRQPPHKPFSGQPAPGDQTLAHQRVPRDATGAAHLPTFGGEIIIRPGPDGKTAAVEIAKPFLIGVARR